MKCVFARVLGLAVSLLILATLAPAQSTWVVDKLMRPGYHFIDLPAAVTAAAPGDILFLRATTIRIDDADTYTATAVQGKGISIVGETGPGLPPVRVVGSWNLAGVPSSQTLLLRCLELDGSSWSFARALPFGLSAVQCSGALVLERVAILPNWQNIFGEVITGNRFTDCSLIVMQDCVIDRGDIRWSFLRSKVMMSGTTLIQSHPRAAGMNGQLSDTMILDASELYAASSTIRGSNGLSGFTSIGHALGLKSRSTVVLSAGSVLLGAVYTFGRTHWSLDYGHVLNPPQSSTLRYDPSVQLIGDPGQLGLIEIQEPQTGLLTTESPGQLAVVQHTEPLAPTFLLMGPFQTTPWTQIIGPVYIDLTNVWSDLQLAPSTGVLTRTFPIPPTIPFGQWAGIQAFSLDSTGRLMASNVSTVGVW